MVDETNGTSEPDELAEVLLSYARELGRFDPERLARMAYRRWVLVHRHSVVASNEGLHDDTARRQLVAFKEFLGTSSQFRADVLVYSQVVK